MEAKTHFSKNLIPVMVAYDADLLSGKHALHPVHPGDLIVLDENSAIPKNSFENWLNLFVDYAVVDDKSVYWVIGLKRLSKNKLLKLAQLQSN